MANFAKEYKGVPFTITTSEDQGRWYWVYKLGAETHELRDRLLPTEEIAVAEAEREAQRRIDQGAGK
jgi:hypothetical protein